MAPQAAIPLPADILSTIGTLFWCTQLIPQIWHNYRRQTTCGLPSIMMLLWAVSAVPFGLYAVVQRFSIPIQIQPQAFCALSLINWAQTLIYESHYSPWKASILTLVLAMAFGAMEISLVLTLRPLYERGVVWPITVVGISAAILLTLGLLPPYLELWRRKGRVVGISFIFLTMDWLGAFFSLMGVLTQDVFDPLGGSLYIIW